MLKFGIYSKLRGRETKHDVGGPIDFVFKNQNYLVAGQIIRNIKVAVIELVIDEHIPFSFYSKILIFTH